MLAVLHTWTRTLAYHPHVHCLVPAGGVSADRRWRPARSNYLVPVRALSKIFRGMFREGLAALLPGVKVPATAWRKDWVVYCKPTVQGTEQVLSRLGRYVHRIALTNNRLLSLEDGQVTFRYRKVKDSAGKTMTLPALEFIRRFLQHVLPAGVHKVRYYGLWNPARRGLLRQVQLLLAPAAPVPIPSEPPAPPPTPSQNTPQQERRCPACQVGRLVWQRRLPRQERAPP